MRVLVGLCWVSLTFAGEEAKNPGKWVVIGSGEPFSFETEYEVKLENKTTSQGIPIEGSAAGRKRYIYYPRFDGHAEGKLVLTYKEEKFILSKKSEEKSFSDKAEAKESLDKLSDDLFSGEKIAFALMEKNISVVDDVAHVLPAHPQVRRFPPSVNAVNTKSAFRYALMLEVKGGVVLKHQFIRQGKPEEGCPAEQEEARE